MSPSLDDLNRSFMRLLAPAPASATAGDAMRPAGPAAVSAAPILPAATSTPTPAATSSNAATTAAAPAPPTVASAPEAVPAPAGCLVDPKIKGYHFDATVLPRDIVEAARLVDAQGFAIDTVTGVDWMAAGEMEVVYDFFHPLSAVHVVLRTRVPRSCPEVPTISGVFPGANWHERETHDFFGIRFLGHPDLSPFLLPEDADYHPLRKDFAGAS